MYSTYVYKENRTNGKQQLPFVCCKRKTETANFPLFAAKGNGKWKFVFLGRQTINSHQNCCCSQHAHLCMEQIIGA